MSKFEQKWLLLNAVDKAAIEGRYLGKSYAKIEEELAEQFGNDGYKTSTLKNYFSQGGKLFETYFQYSDFMNQQRDKEAQVYWHGLIMNAVAVVSEELSDPKSPRRLDAAKMIIESIWGKSVQPVDLNPNTGIGPSKYAHLSIKELESRLADIRAEKERIKGLTTETINEIN